MKTNSSPVCILLRLVLLSEMVDLVDAFLPSKMPKIFIPSSLLLTTIYTLYSRTLIPQLLSNQYNYDTTTTGFDQLLPLYLNRCLIILGPLVFFLTTTPRFLTSRLVVSFGTN